MEDENEIFKADPRPVDPAYASNPITTPVVDPTVTPVAQQGAGNLIDQTMQAQQQAILQPSPEEQRLIDQYKSQLTPISGEPGALPVSTLMPGIGHQIGVGTTSGSLIGSGNIYVPGGAVYGWGVDMARQKALEESTAKRKAEEAAIGSKFEVRKPQQLTDQAFQSSVNKQADKVLSDFMTNIQEKYGEDYRYVMDNLADFKEGQEYIQKMDALDVIVGQANQITDVLTEMQTSIEKGEKLYSEESIKTMHEVQSMLGKFASGDVNELVGLRRVLMDLEGGKSIDRYMKDQGTVNMLQAEVKKWTNIKPGADIPDFATLSTTQKKSYDEGKAQLSKLWASPTGPFASEIAKGLIDEQMINDYLDTYFKNEVLRSKTITSTKDGGGGKPATSKDIRDLSGESSVRKYNTVDGQELVLNNMVKEVNPAQSGKKLTISGAITIGPDGKPKQMPETGFQDGEIVSYGALDYGEKDANGNPIYTPIMNVRYIEKELKNFAKYGKPDWREVETEYEVPIILDETQKENLKTNYTKGGISSPEEVENIYNDLKGGSVKPSFN